MGHENGTPMYYTEIPLTFEVQGTPCAKGVHPYEFGTTFGNKNWRKISTDAELHSGRVKLAISPIRTHEFIESDLPMPIEVPIKLQPSCYETEVNSPIKYDIVLQAQYENTTHDLFNVSLKNLTHFTHKDTVFKDL